MREPESYRACIVLDSGVLAGQAEKNRHRLMQAVNRVCEIDTVKFLL